MPTYNQYRSSPRAAGASRAILIWIKYAGWLSLCLVLFVIWESIFGSDEQPVNLSPPMQHPYRNNYDAFSIENFSSEDIPEQDDAIPDTFYFLGGKPAWFDVTLEGRWMLFRQHLERMFGPFPSSWQITSPPNKNHIDVIRRRRRPVAGPETLSETQMLLLQEEEEGFQTSGNTGEQFRRRSIRGSSLPETGEDHFLLAISVVL